MVLELGEEGCAFNYVVSAHKPTSVQHSAVGHFTSPTDLNLIVSKSTRLEVHKLAPEGLQGVLDVPLYGRVAALQLFRPAREPRDLLLLLTERNKFCVLGFDEETGELVTRANGDASDRVGRPVELGQRGLVDPQCRLIGMHLYDGLFKVIPLDERGTLGEAFNMRLDELKVIDLAFLDGCTAPTIAVLYEDTKEQRHVKTYEVSVRDKELVEGPWRQSNLDAGSSMLIPVPGSGGAVVVGESVLTFISAHAQRSTAIKPTMVKAYGQVDADGFRFLLSDYLGNLYLLLLLREGAGVSALKLEALGRTPAASTISYLDSGVVFVGSSFGDSQLIRLHSTPPDPAQPTSFLEVLDSQPNLGPIVDFCVVDLERQGQGQIVTCSGAGVDGSLRVVRNGIGVLEQALVELPGIKGIWSLRKTFMDAHDTFLVLTFAGETRVLGMNTEDELDEADIPGFNAAALTLCCANTLHDQFLQVTATSARLVDCNTQQMAAEWQPGAAGRITVAAANPTQLVLAVGGRTLVYLELGEGEIVEKARVELESDIACLDVTPLGDNKERSDAAAVGTWAMEGAIHALPALNVLFKETLPTDVIPRSALFAQFEGDSYLMFGLGDGQLVNYRLDPSGPSDRKKIALGTKPISLRTFRSRGAAAVFAASDRPTVIYSANRKLLYSNLNENEVSHMAGFNTAAFPDSLALGKPDSLLIGTIDEIQKLHIRSIPQGEQPRRIAHQDASRTFAVTCTQANMGEDGCDSVRLLDDQTFELLDRLRLQPHELACSVTSTRLGDDPTVYYVVGTAFALPNEPESTKGRIFVLHAQGGKFRVVCEKETRGAVYTLCEFQGRLLAGINSRVQMYKWIEKADDGARALLPECSHAGHVLALYLATRGDLVVVGDLMKSIQLLAWKGQDGSLELRARDFSPNWMSAVTVLDDDTYLGAENSYNLFTVRRNADAATDEERSRLETVGRYHLGEFVNRFQHGSLVMRLPDSELSQIPTVLFGTINGVIGVVASLPQPQYQLLESLQEAMRKVIKGVGGFDHAQWRAFSNQHVAPVPARQFVDGDLIEQFLDLKRDSAESVVAAMGGGASLELVTQLVEELSRLH
ncbi:DNA damage-binding 1 [Micractinium conductrix]|uniref:DNA damage-binding protein 1 n=1 Tax=Micractinium conductrix TaxID=554055 RepID=A0A2P6V388_9CHLO|nr:DNA damage-binding 1 [Micractinium conductrix]|eukprot:PSC68559.1 DNA damage-binding 1 [Micractinium conductrix]